MNLNNPKQKGRCSLCGSAVMNPTNTHENVNSIPGPIQQLALSCSVGCRCSSDLVLLWLWHRPAAAALIPCLAWELPCAMSAALKKKKKKKKKRQKGKLVPKARGRGKQAVAAQLSLEFQS